jgi:hypothetical protein
LWARHATLETRYKIYVIAPKESGSMFTVSFPKLQSLQRVLAALLGVLANGQFRILNIYSILPNQS